MRYATTSGVTRNEFDIDIAGEHTHTKLSGMAIGSGRNMSTFPRTCGMRRATDAATSCSNIVLDEGATAAFEGSIEVYHGARFVWKPTKATAISWPSRDARMHTKPQLLIYNDDVRCSHGATEASSMRKPLFYMQARGISFGRGKAHADAGFYESM